MRPPVPGHWSRPQRPSLENRPLDVVGWRTNRNEGIHVADGKAGELLSQGPKSRNDNEILVIPERVTLQAY